MTMDLDTLLLESCTRNYPVDGFAALFGELSQQYEITIERFVECVIKCGSLNQFKSLDYFIAVIDSAKEPNKFEFVKCAECLLSKSDSVIQVQFWKKMGKLYVGDIVEKLEKAELSDFMKTYVSQLNNDNSDLVRSVLFFIREFVECCLRYKKPIVDFNALDFISKRISELTQENSELGNSGTQTMASIRKYRRELRSVTNSGLLHIASIKASKLHFYLKHIGDWSANIDTIFLKQLESLVKNELANEKSHTNAQELRNFIKTLIDSVFEIFCVAIINGENAGVLSRYKHFIERQLPLILLFLKYGNGKTLVPSQLSQDLVAQLDFASKLPSSTNNAWLVFQSAIVDSIQELDIRKSKAFRLYAHDFSSDYRSAIFDPANLSSVPTNFMSTATDVRHDFLKSCIALKLIDVADFARCLKDDANLEKRVLHNDDTIRDINTGETVTNLPKYIQKIFLSKNPDFVSVQTSPLTRFFFQAPGFEPTKQYQLSLIVLQLIQDLIASRKDMYLRHLILSLLLNMPCLDVFIMYLGPKRIVTPIINFLDSYQSEEADLNFSDSYTDFGSIFLFLVVLVRKCELTVKDLMDWKSDKETPSFCVQTLSKSGTLLIDDSTVDSSLIDDWIVVLFDSSSGISDELISKSSVKQCFEIVPKIFQNAFLAYKSKLIDLDTFKGGVEYFFQPFLLVPLISVFSFLEDSIWTLDTKQDTIEFTTVMDVLQLLVSPVMSEEAKVIHGIILQLITPSLLKTLNKFVNEASAATGISATNMFDPKLHQILDSIMNSNSPEFNLVLGASNRPFTNATVNMHIVTKMTKESKVYWDVFPIEQLLKNEVDSLFLWCCSTSSFEVPTYDSWVLRYSRELYGEDKLKSLFTNILESYRQMLYNLCSGNLGGAHQSLAVQILKKKNVTHLSKDTAKQLSSIAEIIISQLSDGKMSSEITGDNNDFI